MKDSPVIIDGNPSWRLPDADGVVACVHGGASIMWAEHIVEQNPTVSVVWVAAGAEPERCGIAVLDRAAVRAAAIAPAGTDTRHVQIAVQVSQRLSSARAARGLDPRASLTSPVIPRLPPEQVRIPHLVTVNLAGKETQRAVWELLSRAAACDYLAGPLSEQDFFEAHVPQLLRIRADARAGILPNTFAGQRLRALMNRCDLSIEVIYRNPDLFRVLLREQPGRADGQPTETPA
jgi:hypothetical protein